MIQDEHKIKNMIGKILKIRIHDNRIFTGNMICLDNYANIILSNTNEYIPIDSSLIATSVGPQDGEINDDSLELHYDRRRMGLTVIPGKHIDKVWIKDLGKFGLRT